MHAPSTGFSQWYTKPIRVLQDGPCIFPTFKCPSKSKMNSEKQKSKFRYSFWKLIPKQKGEVKFPLFVLVLPLQNEKRKSNFRFSFLVFLLQNKKRRSNFRFSFWYFHSKVKIPLFIWKLPLQNEKRKQNFRFSFWTSTSNFWTTTG